MISIFSKKLCPTEQNYIAYGRDRLALVKCVHRFRRYLEGIANSLDPVEAREKSCTSRRTLKNLIREPLVNDVEIPFVKFSEVISTYETTSSLDQLLDC